MFAVLKSNSSDVVSNRSYCCHLSNDRKSAEEFVTERYGPITSGTLSSNGLYSIAEVSSLDDLIEHMMPSKTKSKEEDVLAEVLKKLEELVSPETAEKFAVQIQEQTGKVVAEVKSMGITGMKAVGDGFIALGDLIRKAGETKEEK